MRFASCLAGEPAGNLGDDVKSDDGEDEDQRQNEDNNGVDLQAGRLVSVELEHGAARATGAGGACAARASIGNLLLLVGSSSSADGCPRAPGGGWRRWAADAGAGGSGRGHGRRGARRRHDEKRDERGRWKQKEIRVDTGDEGRISETGGREDGQKVAWVWW